MEKTAWAIMALWLTACLSEPTGLDCADAPPGTAGCPEPADGAPGDDRGPDVAPPEPDAAADARPDDSPPTEAGPPDGAPLDAAAADAGAADAEPPDAAVVAAPCQREQCPPPPVAAGCFDGAVVEVGQPICRSAVCPEEGAACDPAVLACRAFAGCFYWCAIIESRENCEAQCADRHLDGEEDAAQRAEAVSACLEDAGCPPGPEGTDCMREACGDVLDACLGEGGRLWSVRPPRGPSDIVCDYPLIAGEPCAASGLGCRQGACVDVDGPCQPDPCPPRPALSCDGDTLVETAPPDCRDEAGVAICEYAESRVECVPGPARCVGDVLQTEVAARCAEDDEGARCETQLQSTDCAAETPATCRSNNVVRLEPGACIDAGAAGCTDLAEEVVPCEPGRLCHRGECDATVCGTQCEFRDVLGCSARGGEEIRVRCARDEYCSGSDCEPIPAIHGTPCRTAEDSQACQRQRLVCRGQAAVPMCLVGETPRTGRDTCWTTADCQAGLICTRRGQCSSGSAGSACEDDGDCQGLLRCARGQCR